MEIDEPSLEDKILSRLFLPESKTVSKKDHETIIEHKIDNQSMKRKIHVDNEKNLVTIFTESTLLIGKREKVNKCIAFVARCNEFLPIGCLIMCPTSLRFQFRIGQSFHANSDPSQILQFLIEISDFFFPKILEGLNSVLTYNTDPVNAAQNLVKPLGSTEGIESLNLRSSIVHK